MASYIKSSCKPKITVILTIVFSLILAFGFFPAYLSAQGIYNDGTYPEYPKLKEADFQLFLKFFDSNMDPTTFSKDSPVSEEYLDAISLKILNNYSIKVLGAEENKAVEMFGPSILFNEEEGDLFAKYQDRIIDSVEKQFNQGK